MESDTKPVVISCVSQKGGSGKTTFVVNLSVAALRAGWRVGIVDTDPQGSLRNWKGLRGAGEPQFASLKESQLGRFPDLVARGAQSGLDLLLVDTAPRLTQENRYLAEQSDIIIIPVKPRTFDFWAMEETISQIGNLCDDRQVIGIVSEAPYARGIAEAAAVRTMFAAMRERGIEPCPIPIRRREEYDVAASLGQGVQEYQPEGKGAFEVGRVWRWLEQRISRVRPQGADNVASAGKGAGGSVSHV